MKCLLDIKFNDSNDFSSRKNPFYCFDWYFEKTCLIWIIQRRNTNNIYHAIVSMPRLHKYTYVANPNDSEVFLYNEFTCTFFRWARCFVFTEISVHSITIVFQTTREDLKYRDVSRV